ncbi:SH3 domain-containing protein [Phaeovulum sp. W22_SRMD_FR3]
MIKLIAITATGLYLALQFGAENRYETAQATARPAPASAATFGGDAAGDTLGTQAVASPSILGARRQNTAEAMLIPASLGTGGTHSATADVTVPEAAPALRPEPMPGPPLKPSPEYRQREAATTEVAPPGEDADLRFITANGLNIRAGSGTGYAIIGRARRGAEVAVLAETGGWAQVHLTASGTEGWVASKFLGATAP